MSLSTGLPETSSPRREQRRAAVIETAARLFAQWGYADCEMERVAATAGIAKGTLYLYFESKEALFFACVDAGMKQLQAAVKTAAENVVDPWTRIGCGIRAYLSFFDAHPELAELFIQERANFKSHKRSTYFEQRDTMRGPWRELYAKLQQDGVFRRDLPTERILDTIGNLIYGTMLTNFLAGRTIGLEEQVAAALEIIGHGVLVEGRTQSDDVTPR